MRIHIEILCENSVFQWKYYGLIKNLVLFHALLTQQEYVYVWINDMSFTSRKLRIAFEFDAQISNIYKASSIQGCEKHF